MKISTLILIILSSICLISKSQNVYIPDNYFRDILIYNDAINTDGDTVISYAEAEVFAGTINLGFTIPAPGAPAAHSLEGIEAFIHLKRLICATHYITNLDLSHNSELTYLDCSTNLLSFLDVSANIVLDTLICSFNQLTVLNVKNGNNVNMSNLAFDASYNWDLTCIQVDSAEYSTQNWTQIDSNAFFSEDCNIVGLSELSNKKFQVYPNPNNGYFIIQFENNLKENILLNIYNLTGNKIYSHNRVKSNLEIDIKHLSKGVYFVELEINNNIQRSKIVIE